MGKINKVRKWVVLNLRQFLSRWMLYRQLDSHVIAKGLECRFHIHSVVLHYCVAATVIFLSGAILAHVCKADNVWAREFSNLCPQRFFTSSQFATGTILHVRVRMSKCSSAVPISSWDKTSVTRCFNMLWSVPSRVTNSWTTSFKAIGDNLVCGIFMS